MHRNSTVAASIAARYPNEFTALYAAIALFEAFKEVAQGEYERSQARAVIGLPRSDRMTGPVLPVGSSKVSRASAKSV